MNIAALTFAMAAIVWGVRDTHRRRGLVERWPHLELQIESVGGYDPVMLGMAFVFASSTWPVPFHERRLWAAGLAVALTAGVLGGRSRGDLSPRARMIVRVPVEGWWATSRAASGRECSGDPAFDDAVSLGGDVASALAALGPTQRAVLVRFVESGGTLSNGSAHLRLPSLFVREDECEAGAVLLTELAHALSMTRGSLVERIVEDTEPGVRARAAEIAMTGPDAASTAMKVLARLGVEATERSLLDLLTAPPEQATVAAWMLGEVAGPSALPRLQACDVEEEIRSAAIARIRARVAPGCAGLLTEAGTWDGTLSEAEVEPARQRL